MARQRLITLAATGFIFLGTATTFAALPTGPITNPANSHQYYAYTTPSWTAAEAQAVSLGGHLVTVNDTAESQWICSTFGPLVTPNLFGFEPALIGYNDISVEGSPVWSSGETPSFVAPIDPLYPNSATSDVTQIELVSATFDLPPFPLLTNTAGNWQWSTDVPAASPLGGSSFYVGIAEVSVPEPTTLTATSTCIVLAAKRRRRSAGC